MHNGACAAILTLDGAPEHCSARRSADACGIGR
jgi:hypothetical protein